VSAIDVAETGELGSFAPGAACPSCRTRGLAIFHEQREIPVHSVRLVETYEEARTFPRGSLALGFCGECGFITNTAYDPAPQDYSISYEETQGFSPRFQQFSRELAGRWTERFGLQGKRVVEIGSGKGEFLADMIDAGVATAVGIDPSYDGRMTGPVAERIEFITDYYSEEHARLAADAILCRHTLEHIHETGDLVELVRRSLADRPGTPVLFELPDVMRVLREVAFWDVYYEHCSYFTAGSLARLFRRAGFDVLDVELDYDDQYILLEAKPAEGTPTGPLPNEETVSEVADAVASFRRSLAETKRTWTERLDAARADGRKVVIWGAGSKGVSFLTTLGIEEQISYAIDINPHKHDKFMAGTGQAVVGPEFLRSYEPDLVIAMNPIYLEEIGAQLASMGLHPELIGA
jgi:SAM-dependent methyltransferase